MKVSVSMPLPIPSPSNSDVLGNNGGENSEVQFNDDVKCDCGNLDPNESYRRLVPPVIWDMLKHYFSSAEDIPKDAPVCHFCQTQSVEDQNARRELKQSAHEQKLRLAALYAGKNRPTWAEVGPRTLYVVTEKFISDWSSYVREPMKRDPPLTIGNEACICQHNRLLYQMSCNGYFNERLAYVTPEEWDVLTSYFSCDNVIVVNQGTDLNLPMFSTIPDVCFNCSIDRQVIEMVDEFDYKKGCIYVRKVMDEETMLRLAQCDDKVPTTLPLSAPADEEFCTVLPGNKRKLKSSSGTGGSCDKAARIDAAGVRRRSERRIDQKPFYVPSSITVDKFKIQLVKTFCVMKSDQKLFYNGRELSDAKKTLGQYCIPNNALIYLLADPNSETTPLPDDMEEGFKGSVLMSIQ